MEAALTFLFYSIGSYFALSVVGTVFVAVGVGLFMRRHKATASIKLRSWRR